jgi:hypothetical protein
MGKLTFFKVRTLQIRKFLSSFHRKSANFLDVLDRNSQNRKLLHNAAQLCLKNYLKSSFKRFSLCIQIYIRALYAIFVRGKKYA